MVMVSSVACWFFFLSRVQFLLISMMQNTPYACIYNFPRTREEQKKILSYIIGSWGVYIDVKEIDFVFYVKRNLCVRVM